jgi:geranylgeranyl pyrophosphate synthase
VIGGDHGPDATAALIVFGREIGLAFQLLDDVLDVSGPAQRTGKARGTDLLDGTVTMPLILARDADPSLAEVDLAALDAAGAEAICDRIEATGVLDAVRMDARSRVDAAKRALDGAGLDDQRRELLTLVADGVVERYS